MFSRCPVPLSFAGLWMWMVLMVHSSMEERNWEYEPFSIAAFSSDESLLKIGGRINRLKRGEFACSMTVDWNYDPDENTMIEADAYHSSTVVESDYKILPWSIPQQPFFEFLNGFYKDAFIKNVGHCSNLVQSEGDYVPPWPTTGTTMIEADAYHSSTVVESDYKILPWSIPQQPFFEFLNGFYKDAFIKNVGHCSNLVQSEDDYLPPWPRNVYTLDKCLVNGDGLTEIVPEGFYKIVYKASGQVDWGCILIVKVTTKLI
ncbi:uncharacterized protein LOC117193045 [Drosophila miranda]|uniref:uncharacterized protein LOC117193045 n=1 Tax=Drosophila miranda TaxID=7229 RepID=UPI00143F7E75|nr:uncharacterized protein LOC117193045 [Drosophila miranda]